MNNSYIAIFHPPMVCQVYSVKLLIRYMPPVQNPQSRIIGEISFHLLTVCLLFCLQVCWLNTTQIQPHFCTPIITRISIVLLSVYHACCLMEHEAWLRHRLEATTHYNLKDMPSMSISGILNRVLCSLKNGSWTEFEFEWTAYFHSDIM